MKEFERRTLEVYNFSLFDVNDLTTKVNYSNIDGKDLFLIVKKNILPFFESIGPLNLEGKTIRISSENNSPILRTNTKVGLITGKVNIGDDDGKEQDLTEGVKKQKTVYVKKRGTYVQRPFFFMIAMPKNKKTGMLVFEKDGNHSCKKTFVKALSVMIKSKYGGVIMKEENYIEDDIIKNYIEKGEYNSIKITRQNLPKDLCDKYLGDYEEAGEYELELTIKTKGGTDFKDATKKKVLDNMETYDGFFNSKEFDAIGFDDNTNLKIVSTFEGTTKTIDLSDTMRIRPYYSINVKIGSNGFADLDSIFDESVKLVKSFNNGIL